MAVLRTLLASLPILAGGLGALALATDGFRVFTSETARRLAVTEHPRVLPDVPLQTADGRAIDFAQLRGRWLLVDFIYTRCETYCSVQGNQFAQLQQRLAASIAEGRVLLLSISFDPGYDGVTQLAAYQRRSGDHGAGWIAARPAQATDLPLLLRSFGVTVVPDRMGGYIHNAAIAVVDPAGRLVEVVDWDAAQQAASGVLRRMEP